MRPQAPVTATFGSVPIRCMICEPSQLSIMKYEAHAARRATSGRGLPLSDSREARSVTPGQGSENRPEFRAYFLLGKDGTFIPVRYDQDTKAMLAECSANPGGSGDARPGEIVADVGWSRALACADVGWALLAMLRRVAVRGIRAPRPWTGSWTGAPGNPSVARAISAIICVICAGRTLGA